MIGSSRLPVTTHRISGSSTNSSALPMNSERASTNKNISARFNRAWFMKFSR
ncbi:hypothetical protein D3C72_2094620 [compost metagenome]